MREFPLPRSYCRRLPLIAALATATACATNPATGERELSLIGEAQEIEMGRAAHRDVEAAFGFVDDPGLQQYVQRIGERLASQSERPDLPWTFRLVDDPTVNAFALPGGFVYVTRGLLAHVGSEAELAAVIGHEIGHVTARHAVRRISRAQLANLGLGVGMILSPELRRFGDVAGTGLGLLFLKYSRDDERQSDDLGLRYLRAAGYAPGAMADVFATLERASRESGAGRLPDWLSTHPAPEERRQRVTQEIARLPRDSLGGAVERDAYLRRLDGLVYGPDPREGFFRAGEFLHPDLRFRMKFPSGWNAQNRKRAVIAASPQGDALVGLDLVPQTTLETAARAFASQPGVQVAGFTRRTVHGLSAAASLFEVALEDGTRLRGVSQFVEHGGRIYRLLGYAPRSRWRFHERAVATTLASFAPLTDPAVLAVQPQRIRVVELPVSMTVQEFNRSFPSTVPLDVVARLNQSQPAERLPAGRLLKRVVGEAP